jgi:hypothetical protein
VLAACATVVERALGVDLAAVANGAVAVGKAIVAAHSAGACRTGGGRIGRRRTPSIAHAAVVECALSVGLASVGDAAVAVGEWSCTACHGACTTDACGGASCDLATGITESAVSGVGHGVDAGPAAARGTRSAAAHGCATRDARVAYTKKSSGAVCVSHAGDTSVGTRVAAWHRACSAVAGGSGASLVAAAAFEASLRCRVAVT